MRLAHGVLASAIALGLTPAADAGVANTSPWYVSEATSSVMIQADTAPPHALSGAPVQVSACSGEYEAASVVLTGGQTPQTHMRIEATDLRSASGALIARSLVDLRFVKRWYQADGAWTTIRRRSPQRTLVPELLLKDWYLVRVDPETQDDYLKVTVSGTERYQKISENGQTHALPTEIPIAQLAVQDANELSNFEIAAGGNQQIWITVHVPEHTPAGTYRGALNVSRGNALSYSIPLSLRVWPFQLAPAGLEYGIYYRGILTQQGSISSEAKTERQMRAELADMFAHGIGNPTVYQPPQDLTALRRVLELRAESGIASHALYYLGVRTEDTSASAAAMYGQQVTRLRPLATEFGISDLYFYGIDEAKPEEIQRQRRAWNAIHAAGGRVFAAGWTPGYFEAVGDILDVFVSGTPPQADEAQRFHSRGKRILLYNQPQAGIENPAIYRLNYGVRLWQSGYDGTLIYAYQHGFGSVWNDFDDAEFRDHNFAYPTVNGVIDTLAWEGLREGIDDVRYLQTLAAEVAKRSHTARDSVLADAERVLTWAHTYQGDAPEALRAAVAEQIVRVTTEP
jgi:hypothetical protein